MTVHLQTADGAKTLFPRGIMTPAEAKAIAKITVKTPTGDKIVFDKSTVISGLGVALSVPRVSGAASSLPPVPITTSGCTANVTGGTPPYSYAWTDVTDDGLGGTWSATAPSSATSAFQASAVATGQTSNATFRCTVTDARGATVTADLFADVTNYSRGA